MTDTKTPDRAEHASPLRVLRYRLRRGNGGAGWAPGRRGIVRDLQALEDVGSEEASELASDARHAALQECMADRGFLLPDPGQKSTDPRLGDPDFEAAFGEAMIGDDGPSQTPPPLQQVKLPNGDTVARVGTTITPGTCVYDVQAWIDVLEHERSWAETGK